MKKIIYSLIFYLLLLNTSLFSSTYVNGGYITAAQATGSILSWMPTTINTSTELYPNVTKFHLTTRTRFHGTGGLHDGTRCYFFSTSYYNNTLWLTVTNRRCSNYAGAVDIYSFAYAPDTCSAGFSWDYNTQKCLPPQCPSGQKYDTNTSKCVPICPAGSVQNSSGTCCNIGNADSYYNVDQATCLSAPTFVKIDSLSALTNITWNTCLNACVAVSISCSKGKVFDSNGYCVPPVIDPTSCQAQGGTLQNFSFEHSDACISDADNGNIISPCCEYTSQCKDSSGNILSAPRVYVSCGDKNATDNNTTTDLNVTTPPPKNNNQCRTCPAQYPIANSQGSCENFFGDILMCPQIDYNTSNPTITCGTCSSLGTDWTPDNTGMCQHTTINNIIQYASCPSSQNTTTTKADINTTIDTNSTFKDTNASINKSGANGNGTNNSCSCCPSGYQSIGGNCAIVTGTGQITSMIACPCPSTKTDANGTGPATDNKGTDNNASNLLNGFGNQIQAHIKNAYKGYSFFNDSSCGSLEVTPNVYLFNQPGAVIKDPLPMFVDIITPYRDIIKGFLMFIALIIGLFDFFKRS